MLKKTIFALAIAISAAALGVILWQMWPRIKLRPPPFDKISAELLQLSKKVAAPGPFVSSKKIPEANLTRQGIFDWTNYYRKQGGLPALTFNDKLNSAASAKLADMFANQYFEHVSPAGYGPAHWSEQAGYAYIIIGENLALGDFANDRALLDGWMGSPGHRANIMNVKYQEIGVAASRGIYKGEQVWMAVQEFGMPSSACPAPDESLKSKIDEYQTQLKSLAVQLTALSAELQAEKNQIKTQADADAYNRKADQYNAMLLEYQSLSGGLKDFINQYNGQVNAFNACAGG